jgi:hypothetical protein
MKFKAHALIEPERRIPQPIFVAAIVGVEKILKIELDSSLPETSYVRQALAKVPKHTIAFGWSVGVTVNYAPDRATRYNLKGQPLETLTEARRLGKAWLRLDRKAASKDH